MGSVWHAYDERHSREVALKIVPRTGTAGPRAEREAAAAAQLRHPACLRAYALAKDEGHVYIAYEYVPGRTLRHALERGELDDAAAVEVAAQVLEGLAHAHARGIVHRDVKPSNILLADGDDLSARLLDFGLALVTEEETLTAAGDVPGTLAYISPERLSGKTAGPATDVWSVGVLLWEALAGRHPFGAGPFLEIAKRIGRGAPSLATARPDLPRPLIALVDKALAPEPAKRPAAARLASTLRRTATARPRRRVAIPRRSPHEAAALITAAAPALLAGWTASTLPFFPAYWPGALAAVAGLLALAGPRIGLAFALTVPILPLGNISLGLAILYGAVACGWFVLFWNRPRAALLFLAGPILAPVGALGFLPLATVSAGGAIRRAAQTAAAVLAAAAVAAIGGHDLPFAGSAPSGHPLDATRQPVLRRLRVVECAERSARPAARDACARRRRGRDRRLPAPWPLGCGRLRRARRVGHAPRRPGHGSASARRRRLGDRAAAGGRARSDPADASGFRTSAADFPRPAAPLARSRSLDSDAGETLL